MKRKISFAFLSALDVVYGRPKCPFGKKCVVTAEFWCRFWSLILVEILNLYWRLVSELLTSPMQLLLWKHSTLGSFVPLSRAQVSSSHNSQRGEGYPLDTLTHSTFCSAAHQPIPTFLNNVYIYWHTYYYYYNHCNHYNHYRDSDLDLDLDWERFSD